MKPTKTAAGPVAEIFEGRGRAQGRWYVRVKHVDGTMSPSEAFSNKWNAKRAARRKAQVVVEPPPRKKLKIL